MSRTGRARTRRSQVVKAGALCLATVAAASIGLIGCRSVTATSPADVRSGPHRVAFLEAGGAVSTVNRVLGDGVMQLLGEGHG